MYRMYIFLSKNIKICIRVNTFFVVLFNGIAICNSFRVSHLILIIFASVIE